MNMGSQPVPKSPEFSEQRLLSAADCFIIQEYYNRLKIYHSVTESGHVKLRALYYQENGTGIIVTSDKITKLIGPENFTNIFILCNNVKDRKTRLLLIMGLLTRERLIDGSTTDAVCQTNITNADGNILVHYDDVSCIASKNLDNKESPQPKPTGSDLKFDLNEAHMDMLQTKNCKDRVESLRKNLLQSNTNEIEIKSSHKKPLPTSLAKKEDIFSQILKAATCKYINQLESLCSYVKRQYPYVLTEKLTSILHEFILMPDISTREQTMIKKSECVLILMKYGADVFLKIKERSALHLIAKVSTVVVAKAAMDCVLMEEKNLRSTDGHQSIAKMISHSFDPEGYNPVMVAAQCCNYGVLTYLLQTFPEIVNVKSADGKAYSALTLVTIQALEAEKRRDYLELNMRLKILRLLKKYNGNLTESFLQLQSTYSTESITALQKFFYLEWPYQDIRKKYFDGKFAENHKTSTGPKVTNKLKIVINEQIKNNSSTVTANKYQLVGLEKNVQPVTDNAESLNKKHCIATKVMENLRFVKTKSTVNPAAVIRKNIQINNPKLIVNSKQLKTIPEATKSTLPIKNTPVLVKINKKNIGNFKVVSVGDLEKGNLQFKILNKDLMAVESTNNKTECTPKIIKIQSNADEIHSDSICTKSTPAINDGKQSDAKINENVNFAPIIVKTEPEDETNYSPNVEKIKSYQIDEDTCVTDNIGKKRSLRSDDAAVEEKKSRQTESTKYPVYPESEVGTSNNIDEIDMIILPIPITGMTEAMPGLKNKENNNTESEDTNEINSKLEREEERLVPIRRKFKRKSKKTTKLQKKNKKKWEKC